MMRMKLNRAKRRPPAVRSTERLGDVLRKRREEMSITLRELAKETELSVNTVHECERALTNVRFETLTKIVAALGGRIDVTFPEEPNFRQPNWRDWANS